MLGGAGVFDDREVVFFFSAAFAARLMTAAEDFEAGAGASVCVIRPLQLGQVPSGLGQMRIWQCGHVVMGMDYTVSKGV